MTSAAPAATLTGGRPSPVPPPPGYIPNLDGLRAIAIGLVLLHHAPHVGGGPLGVLQQNGRTGVALFFVISGYLITTLLRREHDATGTVNLPRFFFRRSLRLFPLYYVTLAVYVVLVLGLHQFSPDNRALFVQKLPAYVFYYANLVPHATQGPFFFAWSLSTEEQFYAVFGALFRWLSSRWILAVAGLALAAKLISYATVGPEAMAQGPLSIVFSYREPIVLGVLLAYGLATERGRSIAAWLGKPGPMLTLGGAIVTMLLATPLGDHNLPLGELLYVLMTALVAGAVTGKPFAVLEAAPMTHVGRVSYGIYLLHMLTLDPLKRLLPSSPWLVLALGAVMSVVAATIANRVIERPVARWRARREARA